MRTKLRLESLQSRLMMTGDAEIYGPEPLEEQIETAEVVESDFVGPLPLEESTVDELSVDVAIAHEQAGLPDQRDCQVWEVGKAGAGCARYYETKEARFEALIKGGFYDGYQVDKDWGDLDFSMQKRLRGIFKAWAYDTVQCDVYGGVWERLACEVY